ncbi:MAG TPA: ribonuclease D [Verrucomicrobiales bacterium]|nr:ribonuclease D [Verrucomicrobiales bacterium]
MNIDTKTQGKLIQSTEDLSRLLPVLQDAEWLAVDTEADSLYSYPEKLCLIQISHPGGHELLDPLSSIDLTELWKVLSNRELILHAADYDLRLLFRHFEFRPESIFDTMISARLLGYQQFSLHQLVLDFHGVNLDKSLQKKDWSLRPLSEPMLDYARRDTEFLRPISERLKSELREKGREEWLVESCRRLIETCSVTNGKDPDIAWRLKGCDALSPVGKAVLRELWLCRETEAIKRNKPPFYILRHDTLIRIAEQASSGLPPAEYLQFRFSPGRKQKFLDAVVKGLAVPLNDCPKKIRTKSRRQSDKQKSRTLELKSIRDRNAEELKIDPTLIASRAMLVSLAVDWEGSQKKLMNWQREFLV